MKGELAEVEYRCFRYSTGFAFKRCKTVESKRFGELSHMRKLFYCTCYRQLSRYVRAAFLAFFQGSYYYVRGDANCISYLAKE